MDKKLRKLVLAALLAALCCVGTMVIQIPTPLGGYLHFGDCFVLLSGWLLGPMWGAVAAGVGSALADILTGYAIYAPATLLVKAAVALAAALLFAAFQKKLSSTATRCLISSIPAELIMVGGYFLYNWLLLRSEIAALVTSLPSDMIQGASGVVAGTVLMTLLRRLKLLERF